MSLENQKRQMSCPLWLLLLLLIGAVLLYLLYNHASTKKAQYIQQDIENRTTSGLSGNDIFNAVTAKADGRDITLSGSAASEEDKTQAGLIASDVFGVRQVSNLITVQQVPETVTDSKEEDIVENKSFSSSAKVEPLPNEFLPLPDESDETEETSTEDKKIAAAVEQLKQLDFSSITFEKNSSDLTNQAIETLDIAVATLQDNPEVRVRIEGHTDSSGSPEVNLTISKQRATSVLNYLVGSGIDNTRMEAEGFGDQHPIAPNDTAEGRIKNRRIEIKVINGE